jgi:mono/diheme cytochrome c family protein
MMRLILAAGVSIGSLAPLAGAGDKSAEDTPAERGRKALLGRHFNTPTIRLSAYENVWKYWEQGLKTKPTEYSSAVQERYGLHDAPYPNGGYPMGIREAKGLLGKMLTTDCMICHGGSIMGKSYVGLPNSALDYQALFEDLARATGVPSRLPLRMTNVRGTTEAGAFTVFLLSMRDVELNLQANRVELEAHDDMVEDPPAWWLLKKKKTMYHTGSTDAHSVRALMQFMMASLNGPSDFHREEKTFADIQAFLLTLQPPKYPLTIDQALAAKGKRVFENTCSRCHGTYGENWTYPNKIIPIAEIGTDPKRFDGLNKDVINYFNQSWFAKEYKAIITDGYQAPPLDGIWATAPYLHNGSVPTVYHVLNSKSRPRIYTRAFRTGTEDFDAVKLGWKTQELKEPIDSSLSGFARRKIYDTTQPGRSNGGHRFGDKLSEEERMAVIEYLKTL